MMRIRLKGRHAVILSLSLVVVLTVCSLLFGWTSFRSATRIGYIGNGTSALWSGKYWSLDGTMVKNLRPKTETLTMEFETEEGSLSVKVESGEVCIWEKSDVATETMKIPVPGKVKITLVADHHRGSFLFE